MTQSMNVSSTKWTGILLIFFITRLSQSQTTVSLNREITSSTQESVDLPSGNRTILRKADQEVDSVHLPALNNDRERQTPFYSTTTDTTITTTTTTTIPLSTQSTSTQVLSNSNTDTDQRQLNYPEKQLPSNHELKIIKLQRINTTKTDNDKPDNNIAPESSGKNLFEKLIIHPHTQINNDKRSNEELNSKDDPEDLDEKDDGEPTTPSSAISLANDTMVNLNKNSTIVLEKPKEPKDEIEIINNPILSKTMRIIDPEGPKNKTNESGESDVLKEQLLKENSTEAKDSIESKDDEKYMNLAPKGRTISFGEINRFSNEEKALTKEHEGFIKERPYPYIKSNKSNSSLDKEEEIFALENTIAKNSESKKVITEPSLVFDNSIQQIKPSNQKRSGNSSKNSTNLSQPLNLPKLPLNISEFKDKIKDNVNDIPRNDEVRKTTLDLTENGLSDNSDKNVTNPYFLNGNTMGIIESTTETMKKVNEIDEVNKTNDKIIDKLDNVSKNVLSSLNNTKETESMKVLTTTPISINSSSESSTAQDLRSTTVVSTDTNKGSTLPDLPIVDKVNNAGNISVIEREIESNLNNSTISSVGRGFELETTTARVEYEFVGLTERSDVLDDVQNVKNITKNDEKIASITSTSISSLSSTSSSSASSFSTYSVSSTISSSNILNSSTPSPNLLINSSISLIPINSTTKIPNLDHNTDVTADFNYSEESITTTENGNMDNTSVRTTISAFDADLEHTTLIEETTTVSSILSLNTLTEVTSIDNSTENMLNSSTPSGLSTDISSTSSISVSESTSTSSDEDSTETVSEMTTTSSSINESSSESTENHPESSTESFYNAHSTDSNAKLEGSTEESSSKPETTTTETTSSMTSPDETTTMISTPSSTEMPEFTPEDAPLLVGIVVEGSWVDVCPHLPALRQSLSNLLTAGTDKVVSPMQIIFQKNRCTELVQMNSRTMELVISTILLYVADENGNFDPIMTKSLPSLYSRIPFKSPLTIRSLQLVQDGDTGNAIAVVVISCVAFICLVLLASLLFIMRKRQTRFNYGERCRPVSLDAYSLDSVSAYNSVRRKGATRASKRSYGNPTFEDSSVIPSHALNFAGISSFCNEQNPIYEEFSSIPQVTPRIDELPAGAEIKNRYANVVPLPETRVPLVRINNDPLSEYINASYVRGPKNATKYYIACQAPIESTVTDFWRMIWEQQTKVIIMLTDLLENGVEKCAEYVPPSEITDCHRVYGDYQVTLKKRETKEKYAISTLHLKNLDNNTYREISHIWYLWPANGVQTDAAGLIAVILEARALQRGGPGPIVVHCSPGTGRTGTLIALDLGIRQYEITRTVDVPRVVYTIRRDRAGAVQTKEQYAFIYKALNLYATKLAGGGLEST